MLDYPSNNASEAVKPVFGFWIPRYGFLNPNEDKFPLVHGPSRVPTHFVCSKQAFSELSYMAL